MEILYIIVGVVIIAVVLYPFTGGIREDIEAIKELDRLRKDKKRP
jgi:hypothetical protein